MIERTDSDGVVTLRLAHGKASALDLELVEAIERAIAEIAADESVRAAVLTGTGSIFSAGVDLFRIVDSGRAYVEEFVPALSRMALELFALPKPLVIAANGHAIAGGAIIAFTGDYKLMASGNGRIGTPELLVGVPFPPAIVEVIRFAVPPQHLQNVMYTGRTFTADDALRLGLVDEVVSPDALMTRATEVALQLASVPPSAFTLAKRQIRDRAIAHAKRFAAQFDSDALEMWTDEGVIEGIRAYLAKTVKKS